MANLNREWLEFFYHMEHGDLSIELFEDWIYENPTLEGYFGKSTYDSVLNFNYRQVHAEYELTKIIDAYHHEIFGEEFWRGRAQMLLCRLLMKSVDHTWVCKKLSEIKVHYDVDWLPMTFYGIADQASELPDLQAHQNWNPDSLEKELIGFEEFLIESQATAKNAAESVLAEQYPKKPCW